MIKGGPLVIETYSDCLCILAFSIRYTRSTRTDDQVSKFIAEQEDCTLIAGRVPEWGPSENEIPVSFLPDHGVGAPGEPPTKAHSDHQVP